MQAKDIRYTIEDFYKLPEGTRAELIDGVIYDMAPSPLKILETSLTITKENAKYTPHPLM